MQRHGEMLLCRLGLQPKFICWNKPPEVFLSINRNLLSRDKTTLLSILFKHSGREAGKKSRHPPCPFWILMRVALSVTILKSKTQGEARQRENFGSRTSYLISLPSTMSPVFCNYLGQLPGAQESSALGLWQQ